MRTKTIIFISVFAGILSSCMVPGSDQWKIKQAATYYIVQELKDGEEMEWGYIERKLSRNVNGRDCKYAEVKYSVIRQGQTMDKTLYLLFSEHCDTLYEVSNNRKY